MSTNKENGGGLACLIQLLALATGFEHQQQLARCFRRAGPTILGLATLGITELTVRNEVEIMLSDAIWHR